MQKCAIVYSRIWGVAPPDLFSSSLFFYCVQYTVQDMDASSHLSDWTFYPNSHLYSTSKEIVSLIVEKAGNFVATQHAQFASICIFLYVFINHFTKLEKSQAARA